MPTEILQLFLDRSLLDLGDGTDKFALLDAAARDLTTRLTQDRSLLRQAISLLLGGPYHPEDRVIQLCDEAVKAHWPTYRSRFVSGTLQLFRAAMLQAISDVSANEDPTFAAMIVYTASSALPYIAAEAEDEIFGPLLLGLTTRVEQAAELAWTRPTAAAVPDLKYDEAALAVPAVNAKGLADALKTAAGPSAGATGANPNWPGANNQEWLEHYAKASAEAIGSTITASQKALLGKILGQTRADDGQLVAAVRDALQRTSADKFRTDLLYWKECLYCKTRGCSYRAMAPDEAVFWMAYDLHTQVPTMHPQSAEYFLRETLLITLGDSATTASRGLADFCATFGKPITELAAAPRAGKVDRITLLAALQAVASGDLSLADFASRTGTTSSATATRDDLVVWIFRELQASRLAGAV